MSELLAAAPSSITATRRPSFVAGTEPPHAATTYQAYVTAAFNEMDRQLHGHVPSDSRQWNVSGGQRLWPLTHAILGHVRRRGLGPIRVLNMSGLNEGKPDPVLFDILDSQLGHGRLNWEVVDHPRSQTFENPVIAGWLNDRAIGRIGQDFRNFGVALPEGAADVVLCTEILEHLDYTVGTQLLRHCKRALKPGGLLIVTTPNAVYVEHRIRMALGQWDFLHFMDLPEDVDRGLLGHIMYYDCKRLSRHLRNLGFETITAGTFNVGHGPGEFRNLFTRAAAIGLRAMSQIIPHSGQVVLVTAERPSATHGF